MPAGALDPPGSSESGPTLNASHTVDHRRAGSDSEQPAAQDQGMSRDPDQSSGSPVKFTFFLFRSSSRLCDIVVFLALFLERF